MHRRLLFFFFDLVLPHLIPLSGPLHTYMVLNLLHTLVPALDSRFSETANNLSVALGDTEGVSQHTRSHDTMSWFESHLHRGPLHQVAPRWKHCVLATERGFDVVLTDLLSERTARREVSRHHGDLGYNEFMRLMWSVFKIFIVQQAEEILQNIFSSFKSKLHELKWTNRTSLQFVMKKVTWSKNCSCTCLFETAFCWCFDINSLLSSSRFSL